MSIVPTEITICFGIATTLVKTLYSMYWPPIQCTTPKWVIARYVRNNQKRAKTFEKEKYSFSELPTYRPPLFPCVKFELSEKHTKFEKKILMVLSNQLINLINIKSTRKNFSNYV